MAEINKPTFEYPNQKILDVNLEKQVKKSFIEYSMSVIMSRALPDVRDGMKPCQRRVMYAMYEDNLTHDKPFRKSATTVGNVLGRYHPHGDSSVYGTMVRMAQSFSLRYPLVEGHGNFGSVDGDPPAAYRYTEARLAKISEEMMRDIEKEVVPFSPNFDNRLKEPDVLPCRFPNLLVNGSVGIAVGMATNIPPHNLGEVIDATIYRMNNPECSVEELMEYVKGPDFPTKGIIYGKNGIVQAYKTGIGRVYVRARAKVEEEQHRITITEIPYMVNKSTLVEAMAQLVKDKKVEGIRDIRDLSSDREGGIRIVVDCTRDANCQVILNQLYKYTQLQDTCAMNMLALVHNEPKVLSLPAILDNYIEHQENVITNRTKFELEKALARVHILEGYCVAIDHIDEVVQIMKSSSSIPESKETLMNRFGLSDVQAQAIVDMTLGRLTGLERQKIEDELEKLRAKIVDLQDILSNIGRVKEIIKDEMLEIKRKYSDDRMTEIVEAEEEIDLEDLIPKHSCVITLTNGGYIKRQPADTYTSQRRGGKGVIGMTTKEEDFVELALVANSHSDLLLFTNKGKVFTKRCYRIPESTRTAKGTNLVNLLELSEGEKVTSILSVTSYNNDEFLFMVTKNGVAKRVPLGLFAYNRKLGKYAIRLDENDELWYVLRTTGNQEVLLATRKGMALKYNEKLVRAMGRTSRGVRGIKLQGETDFIVGVTIVDETKKLMTLTTNGFGKRTEFAQFPLRSGRSCQGNKCQKINEKYGELASVQAVSEDDDIMIITNEGVIIRTPVNGIPTISRTAGGVIVMRMAETANVMTFTRVESEKELEEEATSAENENINIDETLEGVEPVENESEDEKEEALEEDTFDDDAVEEDSIDEEVE